MSATDIKRVQFMGRAFLLLFCNVHTSRSFNAAMAPTLDINMESDGEDKQVVNLAAVAREATAKLEKDLADTKTRNDEITWKKKEQVDWKVAAKKRKEDKEVEVKRKVGEDAKKKGSVQPLMVSFACLLQRPEC